MGRKVMKKVKHRNQLKYVLLVIALICTTYLTPTAYAGEWVVNVLVAYDEEWKARARIRYGYSAETLALLIIDSVGTTFYEGYQIRFKVCFYKFWDSDDNPYTYHDMLNETVDEVGFYSGMKRYGQTIHILIAFTAQTIPEALGVSKRDLGVVLVQEYYDLFTYGQLTDELLRHELSHLYHAEHHFDRRDCVLDLYSWYKTTNWCSECREIISSNKELWGERPRLTGGGGGTSPIYYIMQKEADR